MNATIASVTATNSVTLTNKTLDKSILLGTPASAGQIGRDTTQLAENSFDNGMLGVTRRVVACGVGTETKINSTTSDQDFTASFQFPANTIFTNKSYFVTLLIEVVTGVSTSSISLYLKLGSTKVFTVITNAPAPADNVTRSALFAFQIAGRAAAGGTAAVSVSGFAASAGNETNQPVTLATNGALDLIFGITFSGTGSTDSVELQGWAVEELN